MRAAILLLLLGCSSDRVDACSITSDACVTFHLTAEPAIVDALITSVGMWVTTNNSRIQNDYVETMMQGQKHFPIAVGLAFSSVPQTAAKVRILALTGPGPAGYSVVMAQPRSGQHLDQDVIMERPALSKCFNNVSDTTETDLDCGNNCTPCVRGRHCMGPADCQSASCTGGTCD